MARSNYVSLGKVGKVHGLRGELRLWAYNPETELFKPGLKVRCQGIKQHWDLEVEKVRWSDKFALISFKGLGSRELVEHLVNSDLKVERSQFPKLDDGEFYLIDLIGAPVYAVMEGSKEGEAAHIGEVEGFFETGANDVMRMTLLDGSSFLVPFIMDYAVLEVDASDGIVLAPLSFWAPEGTMIPGLNAPWDDPDEDEP